MGHQLERRVRHRPGSRFILTEKTRSRRSECGPVCSGSGYRPLVFRGKHTQMETEKPPQSLRLHTTMSSKDTKYRAVTVGPAAGTGPV
ncbi:hypothetical protein VZT92_003557 [Zoarces viviparus]|uniref:Uncharacterized protein n=1 Tax=Zoarces viviparus TaxID=48416 RepID=A0AAW1FUI5_ZOAVI